MPDLTLTMKAKDLASKEVGKLEKALGGVNTSAKTTSGSLSKLGVSMGGFLSPTALAAGGIFALGGALTEFAKKSIDEEVNIAKLNTALASNVKGWDHNTDAIENLISKREDLAFSDDELRDSLAQLVAATGDIKKSEDVQSVAMDLARLKGISLAEATNALVKVEGGRYKILAGLGIQLGVNATQQDVLNAVEAVAAGQANAFADTHAGKLKRLSIGWEDLQENIGVGVVNIADGAGVVAQAIKRMVDTSPGLVTVSGRISGIGSAAKTSAKQVDGLADSLGNPALSDLPLSFKVGAPHKKENLNVPKAERDRPSGALDLRVQLAHDAHVQHLKHIGHAAGGLVGLNGPEIALLGEKGPEYVVPNHKLGGGAPAQDGFYIRGVSERELVNLVDKQLYFRLSRAAPVAGRR